MVSAQSLIPALTAVLTGPTAAGKTALVLEMARARPGQLEIINADSMLVYRGMDVGTAKPSRAELAEIPHHLIDIREPDEPFTAGDFVRNAQEALRDIQARGKRALIVGGTGFYLRALFYGLWDAPAADFALRTRLEQLTSAALLARLEKMDPASALRIGVADRYRLVRALELITLTGKSPTEFEAERSATAANPLLQLWVIDRQPNLLQTRITARCDQMLREGLVEEVKRIRGAFPTARALDAIGYREVCHYLDAISPAGRKILPGEAGLQQEIELSTRQLVKRQRTWFKSLHGKLGEASRWFELPSEEWRADFARIYPPGEVKF